MIDDAKDYADYAEGLKMLFGEETLHTCVALVQSKKQFHGLHFPGMSLDGFTTHQALLSVYQKLLRVKGGDRK